MAKKIKLSGDSYALVDDEDFERLMELDLQWFEVKKADNISYALGRDPKTGRKGNLLAMHRFIMGAPKGKDVDHIDGNGLNNTKSNLRICSRSQNMMNGRLQVNNTTGYKGVSFHKVAGRYRAKLQYRGKTIILGLYKTALEAAIAYNEGAKKYFGEFARLNPVP